MVAQANEALEKERSTTAQDLEAERADKEKQ